MKEKELVIGTRNKKGILKKIKWLPDSVIISRKEYLEYLKLKKENAILKLKSE